MLLSMVSYFKRSTENWDGNDRYRAFVKLQQGVDPQSLDIAIRKMQEAHQPLEKWEKNGMSLKYYLVPFGKTHLKEPSVRSMVLMLTIVAALLILISLLNYVLIVISSMVRRAMAVALLLCTRSGRSPMAQRVASRRCICHSILAQSLGLWPRAV